MSGTQEYLFDGETYEPELDLARLATLYERVRELMQSGRWFTLPEIQRLCGGSEASCSARLRDMRKERFGGHSVLRRRTPGSKSGLFEYRLER